MPEPPTRLLRDALCSAAAGLLRGRTPGTARVMAVLLDDCPDINLTQEGIVGEAVGVTFAAHFLPL